MANNEQLLYGLLSKILGLPIDSINDQTAPSNVPKWDSLNGLLIVAELESTFKTKFSMQEVQSVTCVGDIKVHLRNHSVEI